MKQTKIVAFILLALLFCSHAQTEAPTITTTEAPSITSTGAPTITTTEAPTLIEIEAPAVSATEAPTIAATEAPTVDSLEAPTIAATEAPTVTTTEAPTAAATEAPTVTTTEAPTTGATKEPTLTSTEAPAVVQTEAPTTTEKTGAPTDISTNSPTSPPTMLDDEEPSQPGTPLLTALASTTVSFTWTRSKDNVAVIRYDIYDGATLIGNTTNDNYTATDLVPSEDYAFTVVALDAAENKSPASSPLEVHTTVLVDNFDDENNMAEDNWGRWFATCNGTIMNGGFDLQYKPGFDWGYNPDGSNSSGARLDYEVDGGKWGFCNLFLEFDEARFTNDGVDLTASNITGVQFQMEGSEGSTVSLQLGTPLADWNWIYYKYELRPSPGWKTIKVNFGEFAAEEEVSYSLSDALASATTLVWEVSQVGRVGWFMIDNVDFTTTESHPGDVTSGATSLSFAVSIFICSLIFGIVQW